MGISVLNILNKSFQSINFLTNIIRTLIEKTLKNNDVQSYIHTLFICFYLKHLKYFSSFYSNFFSIIQIVCMFYIVYVSIFFLALYYIRKLKLQ